MVVEDRGEKDQLIIDYQLEHDVEVHANRLDPRIGYTLARFHNTNAELRNRNLHFQLLEDLKVAMWMKRGMGEI
jgi:hypothetical protein